MLMKTLRFSKLRPARAKQGGAVLLVAIVVLVVMTLGALALVRSVDTTNLIAGNLAFQKSAATSADAGIEAAIAWLEACKAGTGGCAVNTLNGYDPSNGYTPDGAAIGHSPQPGTSWDSFWATLSSDSIRSLSTDSAGNKPSYIIDRMCANPGAENGEGFCMASPLLSPTLKNQEEGMVPGLSGFSMVYYRITVRVAGPRNTVSYVQAMVAI